MDRSIWRQCKSKNRYRDEHTANYYRKLFENERGRKLDYYWCSYCNGFHLTSMETNTMYYNYEDLNVSAVAVG